MLTFDPAPRLPTTAGERRVLAMFAVALLGLLVAEFAHDFSTVKLSAVWMALFWVPLLAVHELGHALAARLVGWRVHEIVIGFGREWAHFRIGECQVRLRVAPAEGYVVPSPVDLRLARIKTAFIYAAGPGAELAVVGLVWIALGRGLLTPAASQGVLALQSLAVTALMGAFFNLLPLPSGRGMRDGLGIIRSLLAGEGAFRHHLVTPYVREAQRALYVECPTRAANWVKRGLDAYPGEVQLIGLGAVCRAAMGQQEQAFAELESLGHPEDHPPALREQLLLDAAAVVLFSGDRALLADAEQAFRRAGDLGEGGVWAHFVAGRVLLERGRHQQAYETLMAGYKLARDSEEEGALIGYLALACWELESRDYAARFLTAAQRAVMGPELRSRVQEVRGLLGSS